MADSRISGRNLVVGPRLSIVKTEQGEWQYCRQKYCRQEDNQNAMEVSLWEVHTDDLETSDVFMRPLVGLMNAAQEMRDGSCGRRTWPKYCSTWSKSRQYYLLGDGRIERNRGDWRIDVKIRVYHAGTDRVRQGLQMPIDVICTPISQDTF
ncbi:hypothetical protein V1524DRAFT_441962 [Lipomyces starkeyi]